MNKNPPHSSDSFAQNALSWDLNQWSQECAVLSSDQLAVLVPYATHDYDSQKWKEKLHQLFIHLPNSPVESFGKALNSNQIVEILHFALTHQNDSLNRKKLSSLFVGLSPVVFKDLLIQSSQTELSFLREEAVTEPIQHHLSLITSELIRRFNDLCEQIRAKELEVETIELKMVSSKNIEDLYAQFENFNKEGKSILSLTGRALAIAWNTNRTDLIQDLGRIKELCQKCLIESIGKTETTETPSTGLYQLIDKNIKQLFSDQDSSGHLIFMKDSTPALEALVKFSVWYIQDYAEVGLLPVANLKASDLDNEEYLNNRDQLFTAVESNLGKMGLKTLLDLKNAKIFSKKALKEFVSSFAK